MKRQHLGLSETHRQFIDRFTAVCHADARVLAAFLGGSYAKGRADAYSDLDLTLFTTDASFESFEAERSAFIRRLGEPLFIEDFDLPNIVYTIFSEGTDAEIHFASPSHREHIRSGAFHILVDKTGMLARAKFPPSEPDPDGQTEKLRRTIYWSWHELSHFITAIGRGQTWWARGELEALRGFCVNLARLRHDFTDEGASEEPYFKLEDAISPRDILGLQDTYSTTEPEAMIRAVQLLLRFYRETARPLAEAHGISYPSELEKLMIQRLETLRATGPGSEQSR